MPGRSTGAAPWGEGWQRKSKKQTPTDGETKQKVTNAHAAEKDALVHGTGILN